MIKERSDLQQSFPEGDGTPLLEAQAPPEPKRQDAPIWVALVVVFLAALALYLCTQTHLNTFDAVSYASLMSLHVNAPGSSVAWMFHPHHLLFNAFGYFCYKTALTLGFRGSSLHVIQIVNGFLGAVGLVLFYAALARILPQDRWLPLLMTIGLAGSFGYW